MTHEHIHTLIVGGGQAGLAMSRHLGAAGTDNLVLERARIAEAWRTSRWDSLVANGPAWHDRFPDLQFDDIDGEAFAPKDRVARYFEDYARTYDLPVRTGVAVTRLSRDGDGFVAETRDGRIRARNVVAATGPFQTPVIPPIVPADAPVTQLHSRDYRNPGELPAGAVLVVGGGSSGTQIADELLRSGRTVYLSVGPHERPPRAYRGHDYCHWLGVLGKWDLKTPPEGREHVTIAVSGAYGGFTVDFRELAARGMRLTGMLTGCEGTRLSFADDLARNVAQGDAYLADLFDEIDAHIAREGQDLAEEPAARRVLPDPDCMTRPTLSLDMAKAGITTIIWATGYRLDFGWIDIDVFGPDGKPRHNEGVSPVPGLYFLGLPWLSMRGSSFIWGVYKDAARLAGHIAARG